MPESTLRTAELRRMLTDRRRELQQQVHDRIRDGRIDRTTGVGDALDQSDAHVQGDMDLTVLQMHADTLRRIEGALLRLDANTYGNCLECGNEIAECRLRALPFAVRCQACEQRREQQQGGAERLALRRGRLSLFSDGAVY
jgi:RNA polymerase-binding transcription factor